MEIRKGWEKALQRTSRESFTILLQARGLMELSKVALEKGRDCPVKRARTPHNERILLLPFPSQ